MIADATAEDVILPRDPQLMGAYGAALLGGTV
jgi:activator of 2-hydroxyglutaryl-CoA dehydratase